VVESARRRGKVEMTHWILAKNKDCCIYYSPLGLANHTDKVLLCAVATFFPS